MKSFFAFALVLPALANKTLEEVYGSVPKVPVMLPWHKRMKIPTGRSVVDPAHAEVRRADNCVFPLEVLILQDASASFQDNFNQMKNTQLQLMTDALSATHPNSKFGVVSFRDKPIYSLGDTSDYCQRFETPLSSELQPLKDVYNRLVSTGGADPPENQFGAIIAASQSSVPGWSSDSKATRLIVVSTDAQPHFADDGLNAYGMKVFSGTFTGDDQCLAEYYPSPEQVKGALAHRDAYSAFLIFDPDWQNGLPVRSWQWFNRYIGQTEDYLNPLANDASNFWDILSGVIKTIEDTECTGGTTAPPTTTTTAPTTTTTAPTTTTTAPTTTTTAPTTTTTAPTTTTTAPTTTTTAPTTATTAPTSVTTGSTVPPVCPPCPGPNPCPPTNCVVDGVMIKLMHRPKKLQLIVDNE